MQLTLLMAVTLDGKIAKSQDHFPDWTGKEDKRFFAKTSRQAGVVIMGSKTFDTIGTPLPERLNIVLTRNPRRRSQWPNLIFTRQTPTELIADLTRQGYSHAILAGGASINFLFAKAQLIDEIMVTISPKIFGQGLSLFSDAVSLDLDLIDIQKLGTDRVLLHYKVLP